MSHRPLRAFFSLVPLGLSLLAGCGRSNPSGLWDGAPMTWEAAPPREIVEPVHDGGGARVPATFDKACTMAGEPWCCYQGNPPGLPLCSWKALAEGMSATFDSAFEGTEKVTLPRALTLTGTTADRLGSGVDCTSLPVGFVLEGEGLVQEPLMSSVLYYDIRKDGTWVATGSRQPSTGLVIPIDPSTRGDAGAGPPPRGNERLHVDQCALNSDVIANVVMFDTVHFELDDVSYEADFSRPPQTETTAFYVRIERAF
jgi:hypothetical protein